MEIKYKRFQTIKIQSIITKYNKLEISLEQGQRCERLSIAAQERQQLENSCNHDFNKLHGQKPESRYGICFQSACIQNNQRHKVLFRLENAYDTDEAGNGELFIAQSGQKEIYGKMEKDSLHRLSASVQHVLKIQGCKNRHRQQKQYNVKNSFKAERQEKILRPCPCLQNRQRHKVLRRMEQSKNG